MTTWIKMSIMQEKIDPVFSFPTGFLLALTKSESYKHLECTCFTKRNVTDLGGYVSVSWDLFFFSFRSNYINFL